MDCLIFLDDAMSKAVDSLMSSSVKVVNGFQMCIICNKACAEKARMQRHLKEDHIKCEPYRCPKCCEVYSCRGVFYDHMADTHHDYGANLDGFKLK